MATLCAATLSPEPVSAQRTAVTALAGPVPLRLADQRASRAAARSDLTQESERTAAEALAEAARAAEQRRFREQAAAKAAADSAIVAVPVETQGGTPEQNRELGRVMTSEYGWDEGQFDCLDRIWSQESNWETTAENPSSGAYGIPQSLPGSKMASAGDDWRTNPATQIAWGLSYIDDVYGTPCSAWSFKQSTGWY